ncbi:MAG: glycosyltransferase [Deferribacterales bacterium]
MKSIIFITYDSPYIDRRILLNAKIATNMGYKVDIVCPCADSSVDYGDIGIINLFDTVNKNNIIHIKDRIKKFAPNWFFRFARLCYKNFLNKGEHIPFKEAMIEKVLTLKADVYVANDLTTLPAGVAAKKKFSAKLVYDAHEFYTEQITLSEKDKHILSEVEKDLIHEADSIITVNEDIAGLFTERYGCAGITVIQNIVICDKPSVLYLHDLIGLERTAKIVLFQGGLIGNRNLESLIHIASRLHSAVVVLAGWGDKEKQLKKLAESMKILNSKVFFVGKISQEDLVAYAGSASIGLIPYSAIDINTQYCTPNKLYEYLCAEVPIVANTGLKTVDRIIKTLDLGIAIDFSSYDEAAVAIEKLVKDDDKLARFKDNIKNNKELFSYNTLEKAFVEIVKSLEI